jgi:hypothetical protein
MKRAKDGTSLVRVGRTTVDILDGVDDLSQWDDSELLQGRRKVNGKFVGRKPKIVAAQLLAELNRRRFQRSADTLAGSLVDGAEALRDIITDETVDPATRIKGIELLYNRVLGLPKQSVDLHASIEEPRWKRMVADAIVPTIEDATRLLTAEADGEIVDAEIVEEPAPRRRKPRAKAQTRCAS